MELRLKMSSDLIGATASTLCTIHCMATPFLFFASTCTKSCCASAPCGGYGLIMPFYLFHYLLYINLPKALQNFG